MRINYTKIVATLGPVSDNLSTIEDLVQAGLDIARLNFSHGSYLNFKEIATNVRKAAKRHDKNVALLQDLQGPKIRLGILPKEGVAVKKGEEIVLSTAINEYTPHEPKTIPRFPVQYKQLHKDIKKGSKVFIDDGIIQVQVTKIQGKEIHCKTKTDGILFTNKGINAPGSTITANPITTKDKKDLKFGLSLGVEYVALSFVRSADDIKNLRKLIGKHKTKIIAKIERKEALDNLEEILEEADGLMIARGDLGVEIKPELVPVVQKSIIKAATLKGKPVITATQVLNSMVISPRPTRAEISDAANAVYDKTDAIMLSNETAVGRFPYKAVQILSKTISAAENEIKKHAELYEGENTELNAACLSAAELAIDTKATKIVTYTEDGYTSCHTMKHRIFTPSITISPDQKILRELALVWGVNQVVQKKFSKSEISKGLDNSISKFLLQKKLVKKGEKIVIVFNAKNKGSVSSLICA
ncbi:pyruvate kinase [Candidatus Peregrinibacteria bacterium]|jgi:pyruvate kinase|nr:pyruvate kinase [Candidatus Peregrinibacteria bacterium]MBT4056259.1 pyruvate kinase [Candidatus Peregrinibacteria bacterium]